jgi:hypothetical protein
VAVARLRIGKEDFVARPEPRRHRRRPKPAGGAAAGGAGREARRYSTHAGDRAWSAMRPSGGMPCVARTRSRDGPGALARIEAHNAAVRRARCRIARVSGTRTRSYGLRRIRWLGLAKAGPQVRLAALACDLRRTVALLHGVVA